MNHQVNDNQEESMKKPIDIHLTKEGLFSFEKEYQAILDRRPEVLARLVAAREQGDLSENAGYHAAKDELSAMDRRLGELKLIFRFAEVIEPNQDGIVGLGSCVTVENESVVSKFTIVGALEADPAKNKLSDVSPIGSSLIGKKIGKTVEIDVPQGKVRYRIISIK